MKNLQIFGKTCKHLVVPKIFFPNRSLLLKGSHGDSKRGVPETHTKRTAVSIAARPGIARPLLKSLGFYPKSQNLCTRFVLPKICPWKNSILFTFGSFSCCCWLLPQNLFLLLQISFLSIDLHACSFKESFKRILQQNPLKESFQESIKESTNESAK